MIAFLFPGQGSQRPRLLADCVELLDAGDLFSSASEILHSNVLEADDADALKSTAIVQRNVYLAGIAGARALDAGGVVPGIVAGHSIGAFVAATVAGVLPIEEALRLVLLRGNAMANVCGPGYGMGAILGLSELAMRSIVSEVRSEVLVEVAAINAVDQIVVAGSDAGVDLVLAVAIARGARGVRRLEVPVASHTSALSGVRDQLASAFAKIHTNEPRIPVMANVDGRTLFTACDIVCDLVEGVAKPVRWFDATQVLYERGTTCFIEAFLGDTLTELIESAFPEASATSLGRDGLTTTLLLAKRYG